MLRRLRFEHARRRARFQVEMGRLTERQRWSAIAALAGLTLLGERRSLGDLIESTPVLRAVDAWGRQAR